MCMLLLLMALSRRPELHFTEGDTAEVYVQNLMRMETSGHWHGLDTA